MLQGTLSTLTGMANSFLAPVEYPDSDGEPMADNTLQRDTIAYLVTAIRRWYSEREDVFVAGDLLWYFEEGNPKARLAPDCMIAIGRPAGYRGSYMQWVEGGVCPQVVFEVLSPKNTFVEMRHKYETYARLGSREYYLIDPYEQRVTGFVRGHDDAVVDLADAVGHRSEILGLTFRFRNDFFDLWTGSESLMRPEELGITVTELSVVVEQMRVDAERAEAENEQALAAAERAQAEAEQARAEAERAQAEAAALRAKLLAAGIDPDA